jgi:sugar phosphate isomerase/epimerase
MHAPLFPDREMGRTGAPAVNLLHPEKARRIAAMDEIKRALEFALTALEHLGAFAHPLGENLLSEPTTPTHLIEILETGHMDQIGVCLDLGHAHMIVGVSESIATLGKRITQVHAHDNHGQKDEHLFPGDGAIDWPATTAALNALPAPPAVVLELSSKLPDEPAVLPDRIQKTFELLD